jgi:hypothetical protein
MININYCNARTSYRIIVMLKGLSNCARNMDLLPTSIWLQNRPFAKPLPSLRLALQCSLDQATPIQFWALVVTRLEFKGTRMFNG